MFSIVIMITVTTVFLLYVYYFCVIVMKHRDRSIRMLHGDSTKKRLSKPGKTIGLMLRPSRLR